MTTFTAVVSGGTTITARGPVREAAERMLGRLWIDQIPVRLASEDPSLWPPAAAGRPLCWPGQPGRSRMLLDRIAELRAWALADGMSEVALIGAGAPAQAAALITAQAGMPPLTVLDGPEPGPLLRVAADHDRLLRTQIVIAGDDPADGALRSVLWRMFQDLGLPEDEIARRFVTVAEPGSAPAKHAAEAGHTLVEAPAATAFGALSPYALVPAGLAGADVTALLDEAAGVLPALTRPENNPGLVLGAILGGAARTGRSTVVLGGYPAREPGLADWIAVLLAEAAGGRLLPLVQRGGLPVLPGDDVFLVTLDGRPRQDDATVSGPLAEQLAVWEYAAAVAAYLLDTDPLGSPRRETASSGDDGPPVLVEGGQGEAIEVHTADPAFAAAADLPGLLDALADRVAGEGHLAIAAYLDPDETRGEGAQVRRLAALLAARCARPVTISWGCRYPAFGNDRREKGVYLVVTGNAVRDVPVPDRHVGLGPSQRARAFGAARAARGAGRPVVRLHLQNRRAGLARLLDSARGET